jgi:hypothetical protein
MIQHTAWSANNTVCTFFKSVDLGFIACPAVNWNSSQAMISSQDFRVCGDLLSQLTGWYKDKCLSVRLAAVNLL